MKENDIIKSDDMEGIDSNMTDKIVNRVVKDCGKVGSATGKAAAGVATKAIMPLVIKIVLGVVLAGALGFGAKEIFTRKQLAIADTVNVVDKIKKIGEFTTVCYYEELAIMDKRIDTTGKSIWGGYNTTENEIVLIGKGRVRAGFDLKKVKENDIYVHGDTLDMIIPKAEVFDIIMNPSDFTTEYESGTWSHENTKSLKARAKQQLEQDALECGLLKKAETNGQKRLKSLFAVFGYKTINIAIKE